MTHMDKRDPNSIELEDGEEKAAQRTRDEIDNLNRIGLSLPDIDALAAEVEAYEGVITVDWVSLLFEAQLAGRLKFDSNAGCWYQWDGAMWHEDSKSLAFEAIRRMLRSITNSERIRAKDLKDIRNPRFAAGVERFSRSTPSFAIEAQEWNPDLMALGTPGGTVNLRTGLLSKPRSDNLINQSTLVAPASKANCPKWMSFLFEACGDDMAMVRYLQRWAGYCLTGQTREHALMFLHGPGGNGKSLFINVISRIMGDYAAVAAMETFISQKDVKHSTDLASLNGPRLVVSSETEKGRAWNEQRIKSATGGDFITARFMRQDNFTFKPQFKLIIVGNHTPRLLNVDDATKRRFNIVPFTTKPAKPDKFLEDTIINEEGPEVLRWMIDGCLEWQSQGLAAPKKVAYATNKYFRNQDVLQQWINDYCIEEAGARLRTDLGYTSYHNWMIETNGEGHLALSKRAWSDAMEDKGFERYRTNGERGVSGIRARDFNIDGPAKNEA